MSSVMGHVIADDSCVGCRACANRCPLDCIEMVDDADGFSYPDVDESTCTACGLCLSACPIANSPAARPVQRSYASRSREDAIRSVSSSGGLFTVLARQVLADGGIVVGAAFSDDSVVAHRCVDAVEALAPLRGSKYVQSDIGTVYREVADHLGSGRPVLFSGTPCQVAGLRTYLGVPHERLVCVDIVCHGVPSPSVWMRYVAHLEAIMGGRLREASFRDKRSGWRRYSVSMLFDGDARYVETVDRDPYMRAFLSNVCLRPSCYACAFKGADRQGDISLADFWGVESIMPQMDDNQGTSLVMVSSEAGRHLFERVESLVEHQPVELDGALALNQAALVSPCRPIARQDFFRSLGSMPFDRLVGRYASEQPIGRARSVITRLVRYVARRVSGGVSSGQHLR